jgi:hypothetical protein
MMRNEYDDYFSQRYRNLKRQARLGRFRNFDFPPFFLDDLLNRIPIEWRSDARFFLANNMVEMIVKPYYNAKIDRRPLPPYPQAWNLVFDDLEKLISVSEQVAAERNRSYVSATSVAVALGQLAEKLLTTSLQIWGPGTDDDR